MLAGAQEDPSVQVVPLIVIVEFTRSALVTRPVAVNDPVTMTPDILGEVAKTALPLPVTASSPRTLPLS